MNTLFIISARGGSKGIPGKNIKLLLGKPLIYYSIDIARFFSKDDMICVSTDDDKIIEFVEKYNLKVPFKRPDYLATDQAGSYEVIMHALEFYEKKEKVIDKVILLQPTSPLRLKQHISEAIAIFNDSIDMVVGTCESHANPYYNLFVQNTEGLLEKMINSPDITRRQDAPKTYQLNGAVYVFNVNSLKSKPISEFKKIKSIEMPQINSVDIDTPLDWLWTEFLLEKKIVKLDDEIDLDKEQTNRK